MNRFFLNRYFSPGLLRRCGLLIALAGAVLQGCQKAARPVAMQTSSSGNLSRYDLTSNSYDVLPVNAFTASYNSNNQIIAFFQKAGQTLLSYSLSYNGNNLTQAKGSNLSVQTLYYNAAGKPALISFTSTTDTGHVTIGYDSNGKLISTTTTDQVIGGGLPTIYQYLYTYDAAGNNVVQITENSLDLQGRPTLRGYSFYTFDNSPNPFTAFPYLQSAFNFPGNFPALVNKNNILTSQIVGTVPNTSSPGSVPTLDTITTLRTSRQYQYNAKGYPFMATEKFNDIQNNYSGNRTFTYEY